jgi:GNAT superfamily N-acetyltransferase
MPELSITLVDNETDARAAHSVDAVAQDLDHPDLPADPVEEYLSVLTERDASAVTEQWLARADGEPAATGRLFLPLKDNQDRADLKLRVLPALRRRGIGTAVVDAVRRRLLADGRHTLTFEVSEPMDATSASALFAIALGAQRALDEIRRSLDLTSMDLTAHERLRAEAESHSTGYEIIQWTDRAPDDIVEGVAVLVGRMTTDAPMGDMDWQPEAWDVERYRTNEQKMTARGRLRVASAARHVDSGRLVAYTDLGVSRLQPEIAHQWDTIVLHEHRGHRLGLLVKLANLQLLQQVVPRARVLHTWNAEVNSPMVAINDRLGFVAVERTSEWQLDLRPPLGA